MYLSVHFVFKGKLNLAVKGRFRLCGLFSRCFRLFGGCRHSFKVTNRRAVRCGKQHFGARVFVITRKQGARMTRSNAAAAQGLQFGAVEGKQAQGVSHRAARFTHSLCNLFLGQPVAFNKRAVTERLFNRV